MQRHYWWVLASLPFAGCTTIVSDATLYPLIDDVVWISVIPKWKGYRIRQSILELPSGEVGKLLVRVPLEQLDDWDATHDAQGRKAVDGLDSRGSV